MEESTATATAASTVRRVFDCCLFNGEMDVLAIRFHELNAVVDHFVIVESTLTFSGLPQEISFNPCHPSIAPFAAKVRHIIVADMPETSDPWVREAWQRNAVLRGVPDAAATDLLVLSDVDEIPRSSTIAEMIADSRNEIFGFRLAFYYFYVNYRNVAGPEAALTWTIAATRRQMDDVTPNALRYAVREGRVPARLFDQGGWHFSYLMDEAGIRRKIAAFSHQEFNTQAFLSQIDIAAIVREGRDFFDRPGFVWKLMPDSDLPLWLRQPPAVTAPIPSSQLCRARPKPLRPEHLSRRRAAPAAAGGYLSVLVRSRSIGHTVQVRVEKPGRPANGILPVARQRAHRSGVLV